MSDIRKAKAMTAKEFYKVLDEVANGRKYFISKEDYGDMAIVSFTDRNDDAPLFRCMIYFLEEGRYRFDLQSRHIMVNVDTDNFTEIVSDLERYVPEWRKEGKELPWLI